ncbi:ATP-grasp fold amidoligase family protein [Vibrio sp. 1865]|uniref:ATP-grasp fold amidoligase family protein n=1 Tax=unclassified Vibrio TaxID=2614977 RepID=UPI002963EA2D|nr:MULTISPECIES: ATP-grasp fold amidoligase family protein [unclassified Vibrio]MDW2092044.1 ATP-grasp fold amidoligase family protein [Vibrio sp. 1866]MDW3102129.1 ATP-grasp fold amidoligase family protein [Vibrio sp. 1874]MDW3199803.1 ATP-grasp fold amidoligase family protein [Vibrio sp. 1865]
MLIEVLRKIRNSLLTDEAFLRSVFKKHTGYKLNLNNPRTLNEKLQWLKINDRRSLLTKCADKYEVRQYIETKIGKQYLIPLLNVFESPEEITLEKLPSQPFIIKANHTSGTFKIVRDKSKLDIEELKVIISSWLDSNYYDNTKEWQYKNIKPLIIVEKLLLDQNGNIPSDIKLACINGKVEIIHVDSNKEVKHLRNHYDTNWNALSFRWPREYGANKAIEKPKNLKQLIDLAELLAEPFDFVRVDFYILHGSIYFGELTFHPTSGYGKFEPFEYDVKYGKILKLTKARNEK